MTSKTRYPVHFHSHPGPVVALPEYHQARTALDQLVKAMLRAGQEPGSQEAWIAMASDFASTNVYGDLCKECRNRPDCQPVYPHRTEPHGNDHLACHYLCPVDGHSWTTWYAIDFPLHFEPTY
jgi:hypothetical protein